MTQKALSLVHHPWMRIALTAVVAIALALSLTGGAQGQELDEDQKKTLGLDVLEGEVALGNQDLRVTVAQIINAALTLLGIIAVVVILVGGFYWMTAGGNEEGVTKAKGWIFSGIIGLAIILSAWAIANFVIDQLGSATGVQGTP